eukprot:TRINITY_DN95_c0_g1_i8.p1 TRINITY_DN95_c0_g1~~TRINITY_DN95_c0_g1_i8.p1  ORF type:complete len:80 (-),score=4.26 TRINITY_DN95_c0_g1_i8:26-265(-)
MEGNSCCHDFVVVLSVDRVDEPDGRREVISRRVCPVSMKAYFRYSHFALDFFMVTREAMDASTIIMLCYTRTVKKKIKY